MSCCCLQHWLDVCNPIAAFHSVRCPQQVLPGNVQLAMPVGWLGWRIRLVAALRGGLRLLSLLAVWQLSWSSCGQRWPA